MSQSVAVCRTKKSENAGVLWFPSAFGEPTARQGKDDGFSWEPGVQDALKRG
jgi:hypothetical protein